MDLSINLEHALAKRSIDLAIQSGPFVQRSSGKLNLGIYPMVWVAAPGLGLPRRKAITLEQLAEHPVLTHACDTQPFKEVSRHFSKRRDIHARLVPSSNLAACIQMAVDCFGSAVIPEIMVHDELKRGELFKLNYPWTPDSLKFYARYDRDQGEGFVARAAQLAAEVFTQSS